MTDTRFPTLSKQVWPHELVAGELDSFYGNPRGSGGSANSQWETENITHITPPWAMQVDGSPVHTIAIHKKCAESLQRILNSIWAYYGQDQSKIDALHLNEWGGSYNYRVNVNAPSKLSLHAYAAAIDLSPNENPNGKPWVDGGSMLPRPVIDAFLDEGWSWGGDFNVTKDAMHFQATFNAHSDAPSDAPQLQPSSMPPPMAMPSVAIPNLIPDLGSTLLVDLRQFLLDKTGVLTELDAFKASVLGDLAALNNRVNSFTLTAVPLSTSPPAASSTTTSKPSVIATTSSPAAVKVFTGITATVFGGVGDEQPSAYKDVTDGWPSRPGVALPYHLTGSRPKVNVTNPSNGKSVVCDIVDVGPWNTNDPYWQTGNRPQAESGTDMEGRHTNLAGIDLTPSAAAILGIDGKGKVNWNFVSQTGAVVMSTNTTQSTVTVPVASAFSSKINWTAFIQVAATLLTVITGGKINLTAEQQVAIIGFIGTIAPIATMVFRTFGTTSITPQSLPK